METNFEKAKDIIIGQTEIMQKGGVDDGFIESFNADTIKALNKMFNLTKEEISKLKEL